MTKLRTAQRLYERGGGATAVNVLQALLLELDALVQGGTLTAPQAAPLRDLVQRVIAST